MREEYSEKEKHEKGNKLQKSIIYSETGINYCFFYII